MSIDNKRYSPLNEQATLPTQNMSFSPTDSTLPFSIFSIAMPPLVLQKPQPLSPLWPTLAPQCCFVDYDSIDGKYHPIKVNKDHSDLFIRDIAGLILSYIRVHVKPLPKNPVQARTLVHKIMKPIIFPVFDIKKYAFVFQTTDHRIAQSGFEASDRFLILISEQFLPYTLAEIVKTIIREQYQDRMKNFRLQGQESVNTPSLSSRALFLSFVDKYLHSSKKFYFSNARDLVSQRSHQLEWYLKQIHTYSVVIRMNSLHYQPVLLLTLMIYYSIRQYKIILMGEKQNRHIMSQISIALKAALNPVEYCYPIIFAAISQSHEDYMDAPVPCLVCYWGEERDISRVKKKYRQLSEQAAMPTILIDLNTFTAFDCITNEGETRAILEMNRYILGQKEGAGSVVNRANRYIREELINCTRQVLKEQQRIFKQSLSFQNYQQSIK